MRVISSNSVIKPVFRYKEFSPFLPRPQFLRYVGRIKMCPEDSFLGSAYVNSGPWSIMLTAMLGSAQLSGFLFYIEGDKRQFSLFFLPSMKEHRPHSISRWKARKENYGKRGERLALFLFSLYMLWMINIVILQ